MSFQENADESEDSDGDSDETARPRFSSIRKVSGFLDKELAASGFTKKDQDEIEKLNEGDLDDDSNDTDGAVEEDELPNSDSVNELNTSELDSLCLLDKDEQLLPGNNTGEVKENRQNCEGRRSNGPENQDTSDQEENGENEDEVEDNPELVERLARQRRRAIQAARGHRKTSASRNAYKDKGGRSSNSSRIQKQLSTW